MADAATSSAEIADAGTEFHGVADAFVAVAERALANGGSAFISSGDLERVITTAMKLYAAKAEVGGELPAPVSADEITPTEVVMFVSEVLRAANLNLFDLAMWYRRAR